MHGHQEHNSGDSRHSGIGIPSLHKLKSVSAELNEFKKKADEELMIKDNKIPSDDDDHDHEDMLERQRAVLAVNADHDL